MHLIVHASMSSKILSLAGTPGKGTLVRLFGEKSFWKSTKSGFIFWKINALKSLEIFFAPRKSHEVLQNSQKSDDKKSH